MTEQIRYVARVVDSKTGIAIEDYPAIFERHRDAQEYARARLAGARRYAERNPYAPDRQEHVAAVISIEIKLEVIE